MKTGAKLRVLCVEDELALRQFLQRGFASYGFEVETAACAEEGLDLLDVRGFDAMVTDINLPEMNGVELCQRVRAKSPSMFIVAITGYANKYELSDCKRAGFDAYFTKPLNLGQLCDVIREGSEAKTLSGGGKD